jgi:electron transport complex protein RnfG
MNSVVKQMFTVLMVVGAVSGMILAGTETLTQPLIEKHKREALKKSIFIVVPDAKTYEEVAGGEFRIFKGLDENNDVTGYAFLAEGPGFQGKIKMIVGIEDDFNTLLGMKVLEQLETPGLGAKIAEDTAKPDFFEQFQDLQPDWTADDGIQDEQGVANAADFLTYIKNQKPDDPNEIQAITGATISSAAVVEIINTHLDLLEEQLTSEQ